MKMLHHQWFIGLVMAGLLAGCEPQLESAEPQVEVRFAQPFPAKVPNLLKFPAGIQGRYATATDATAYLSINDQLMERCRAYRFIITTHQFDSLNLPSPVAPGRGPHGEGWHVQAVGADSVRLRWEERDTLAALGPRAKLRRYRGWYYLSTPSTTDSTAWTVQRLVVMDGRFLLQSFNPDTLRIRALDPAAMQLSRADRRLIYTLNPDSGRATRQVSGYDGLWLSAADYSGKVLDKVTAVR